PWYAYEIIRTQGEFANDFFLNQNISRFTGVNMSYCGGKRRSFFYYIPLLFAAALPWSLLAPFGLFNFRRKLLKLKSATYYLIIWFAVVFLFFSCAAVKRGDYLLPLFAPAAILLGRYLQWIIKKGMRLSRKWHSGFVVLVVIAAVAVVVIRLGFIGRIGDLVVNDKIKWISYRDGMNMLQIDKFINEYFVYCCTAAAIVTILLYVFCKLLEKGRTKLVLNSILVIVLAFFCVFYIWIDPAQNKFKTVKYFCERSRQHVKADETVCFYVEWITEAVFFMNRDYDRRASVPEIYDSETHRMKYKYIITEPEVYEKLPSEVKARLKKLEETIPGHQYPHVLLEAF
ncbi:MAG: hypothetical protein PHV59_07335, partial [Victivallales bacterium]|nr:hypothetical protein [Victivallales bacterium]